MEREYQTNLTLNHHIIAFYPQNYLLYHEISAICQKDNKNGKICDNIVEVLPISLKSELKTKVAFHKQEIV